MISIQYNKSKNNAKKLTNIFLNCKKLFFSLNFNTYKNKKAELECYLYSAFNHQPVNKSSHFLALIFHFYLNLIVLLIKCKL